MSKKLGELKEKAVAFIDPSVVVFDKQFKAWVSRDTVTSEVAKDKYQMLVHVVSQNPTEIRTTLLNRPRRFRKARNLNAGQYLRVISIKLPNDVVITEVPENLRGV